LPVRFVIFAPWFSRAFFNPEAFSQGRFFPRRELFLLSLVSLLALPCLARTGNVSQGGNYSPIVSGLTGLSAREAAGRHTLAVGYLPNARSSSAHISTRNSNSAVAAVSGTTTPVILWAQPTPVPYPTPLSAAQLNAVVVSGAPVLVPLTNYFNITGITTPGFSVSSAGGYDLNGATFSSTLLGSTISWNGVTFPLGPQNLPNAVTSKTIQLPPGTYGALLMLGDLVNNPDGQTPATGNFTVLYTDGTSETVSQTLSDWVFPKNFVGESTVRCEPSRLEEGKPEPYSVCVYGYQIALDSTRAVESIELPNDENIVLLAMALLPPVVPGAISYAPASGSIPLPGTNNLNAMFTPADPTTSSNGTASVQLVVTAASPLIIPSVTWPSPQPISYGTPLSSIQLDASASAFVGPVLVPLASQYRVNAIYEDGVQYGNPGFDGSDAFSASRLGNSLYYAGAAFPLGPPDVPDSVTSTTIPLPEGNYDTLYLLGAATSTPQLKQSFTVTYTDGSSTSAKLDMSSWLAPQYFQDETIVAATTEEATEYGTESAGTFDVYGYQITVDPTKTVNELFLPYNLNVVIMAAGLSAGGSLDLTGNYAYTPSAGAVLPAGTDALAVVFTENDTADFAPVPASNTIQVLASPLVISANNAARLFGAASPTFTGSITGAQNGDQFTETFTTTANALSAPGTYPIIPAANGPNLADYTQTIQDGSLTVNQAPVTVGLTTSSPIIGLGNSITLTASVQSTTAGTPTGQVTFSNGANLLGTATLSNGVAALSTTQLPLGTNAVSACYSGDQNFVASCAGSPLLVTVDNLSLIISANNASRLFGAPNPTFTGSITGTQNGDQFTETFNTTASTLSPPGNYSIIPVAAGANLAKYIQTVLDGTLTVNQTPAIAGLTSSSISIPAGSPFTLTANVQSTTTGTPTGIVTFFNGATKLGTASLVNGAAVYPTALLTMGNFTLIASYAGDANFLAEASNAVSVTVLPATTTTLLSASPNPAPLGTSVTFSAAVSSLAGIPAGNVSFYDGAVLIGSGTLASGVASYSASTLAVGSHNIVATYTGTTAFDASASSVVAEQIADFNISATPASRSIYTGEAASFTVTVTPVSSFSLPITLACSQLPAHVTCSFSPATVTTGTGISTLIVQTTAPSQGTTAVVFSAGIRGAALAGVFLLFISKRIRRYHKGWLILIAILAVGATITGCSAPSSLTAGTPLGAQTINVIGTATNGSETLNHETSVTVNVASLF